MSAERIDVLAVMEAFARRTARTCTACQDPIACMACDVAMPLREARAAVAELMRAARDYQNAMEDYVSVPRRVVAARNLRTALARVVAP